MTAKTEEILEYAKVGIGWPIGIVKDEYIKPKKDYIESWIYIPDHPYYQKN